MIRPKVIKERSRMIEVRILDKNHVEAASGLRLARLHRAAELIGELDTGVNRYTMPSL